jgi:hypothetical protein
MIFDTIKKRNDNNGRQLLVSSHIGLEICLFKAAAAEIFLKHALDSLVSNADGPTKLYAIFLRARARVPIYLAHQLANVNRCFNAIFMSRLNESA